MICSFCRSGLTVITACGSHNFDFVKSYGADAVFDYNDFECGARIRDFSNDDIVHVLDTISERPSASICADAMSMRGGRYTSILAVDFPRTDCKTDLVMAYSAFSEEYKMGPKGLLQAAMLEDHDYCAMFFDLAQDLLAQGKFRPHQVRVGNGGLHGVLEGLDLLRAGKVSGRKLVYRVSDTA
jgi:NADPH:quinone reductase-like Zn-dependent oxidoreductase